MKNILSLSFYLLGFTFLLAQELPEVVPPSPEAASLGKFSEVPISHYTGLPNISVPITSYSVGGKNLPVSISYHARGLKVGEIASRVGLGWALNAGGQITRQTRDKPDDSNRGFFNNEFGNRINSAADFHDLSPWCNNLNTVSGDEPDRTPDLFNIQVNGLSAKFMFDYEDGKPVFQKYDDIHVEHSGQASFIITDKAGYKYWFGVSKSGRTARDEDTTLKNYTFIQGEDYTITDPEGGLSSTYNNWHLMDIESPNGDIVSFFYTKEETFIYRKSYDEFNTDLGKFMSHVTKVRTHQYQLSEIRYNYKKNTNTIDFSSYENIVFEANDLRQDIGIGESKKLSAITTLDREGNVIKSHQLSHSYMVSPQTTNYLNLLANIEPSASKRLVLDAIHQVGTDGESLPPHVFTYNTTPLPNRFSSSQDLWGYYNGKNNGEYLGFHSAIRVVDTTFSQAGMLEKITYPTGGSTQFTYEHNRGVKGDEFDHIRFPKVNPIDQRSEFISNLDTNVYNGNAYVKEFSVGTVLEFVNLSVNLPNNQNIECASPSTADCRFSILLQRLTNGNVSETITLNTGSAQLPLSAGTYRLTVNPMMAGWQLPPYDSSEMAAAYAFMVNLTWEEAETSESEVLYAGGKRIKTIEFLDSDNTVVSKKAYRYKKANGISSGVILSIPNFGALSPISGQAGLYEPGLAISGSPFSTYQGNVIGYSNVTEYYGDETHNYGKTVYNFSVIKDSGDYTSFPITPPTDNEWLRGLPQSIIHYKNDNGTYKKVTETQNTYSYAGTVFNEDVFAPDFFPEDFVFTPQSIRNVCPNPLNSNLDIFYDKTRTYFRMPLIHFYYGATPEEANTIKYKLYYFTGGTVDQYLSKNSSYDANEQPRLVTENRTQYNYTNHYQPVAVTSVTSDGKPVIQTMTYPQDKQNPSAIEEALIQQNRFIPLETKTYKDLNANTSTDSNELLSTSVTTYNWFASVLEPSIIQTSKGTNALENRIIFKDYDTHGNPLEAQKVGGTSVIYVWGYNNTKPIAKIDNASYTGMSSQLSSLIAAAKSASSNSTTTDAQLRTALDAIRNHADAAEMLVSSYTYKSLVGVTSMTDPQGNTVYYEYDSFNRLKQAKDKDGNILSKNEYNYAQN